MMSKTIKQFAMVFNSKTIISSKLHKQKTVQSKIKKVTLLLHTDVREKNYILALSCIKIVLNKT